MYDLFSMKDFKMPDNFLWGSGYSGHQVEGNNIHSHRWAMEQDNNYPEKSGLACNSYEMYETDVELVKNLGHKAFRTSVEWCRIEPEEGVFNAEAADHYIKFFSKLKENGIQVFATLVHASHPNWFEKKKGFGTLDNLKSFERYLEYIVPKIAPYVDFWNVLNEFNTNGDVSVKLCSVKYHALGYHIIKRYSSAPVSSAHAFMHFMPYRPNDKWDGMISEYRDMTNNEFFFHAMRTGELVYPFTDAVYDSDIKNTVDYWAVNCYIRKVTDARSATMNGKRCYDHKRLKLLDMDFYLEEMYPESIMVNLSRLKDKPIYITENGCCCNDDRFRIVYLALHLSALAEAIEMGADVRGYLYWSLLDNYEWFSYEPRFGLCDVDFQTFERTPKPSALFYKDIIANNGFNQEIIRKYLQELPSLGLNK